MSELVGIITPHCTLFYLTDACQHGLASIGLPQFLGGEILASEILNHSLCLKQFGRTLKF